MIKQTVLENKIRLITKSMPNTASITIMILVGAGSRYENKAINGIAHFLEHMFFKGAKKYKNTKEVSSAIDSIGGDFNAFTAKEYAGYYVKLASSHLDTGLDVLSDMMINAKFDPTEIDKERGVILEEYNMYQDTPMYQTGWNFENLIYGEQPLGWDQIGTKKLINSVQQKDFQDFQQKLYTTDNTVICLAGDIAHDVAVQKVSQYFQNLNQKKKAYNFLPINDFNPTNKIHLVNKKTEQAHMVIGFKTSSINSPEYWPSKVLATILGGNMSSRMFLNVREAKGLCYYVRTETDHFFDTGTLTTKAGVDTTRASEAIQAITNEYRVAKNDKIQPEELQKAKEYLKGKIILKLEDSEEYAHMLARQELILNKIDSPETIITKIDKVTLEELHNFMNTYFTTNNLYASLIGPYSEEQHNEFTKLLII